MLCGDAWSGMGIKAGRCMVKWGIAWCRLARQGLCGRVRSGSVRCGEPWLRMVW